MDKNRGLLVCILLFFAVPEVRAQDDFQSIPDAKFTDVNQVGLMINNNGFLGTNLPNEDSPPSFEFPLGTDIERMIRGGIWIGAINNDNDMLVSTATIDGAYTAPINTEFKEGPLIKERSTLRNSPFYSKEAVSEQDYVCFFVDTDPTLGVSQHRPLPVKVTLRSYAWSFVPVDQMVILSYTIENIGQRRLENVYVGHYAELLTCSKAFTQPFPSGCFWRKHLQFDTERQLVGNHYYNFAFSLLPGWGGFALLGSLPDSIEGKTITYEWWEWDDDLARETQDAERYQVMSSGVVDPTVTDDGSFGSTDPVTLIAAGPYRFLDPGDTLNVVFAALGGRDWDDLLFRADWAHKTFESGYQIPLPPPSPRLVVEPGPNTIRLLWEFSPEEAADPVLEDSLDFQGYRIYLSRDNVDFTQLAQFDIVDTIGFNTGFAAVELPRDTILEVALSADSVVIDTFRYAYEIPDLKDGFEYFVAITSFDKGLKAQAVPSLESGVTQNRTTVIPGPRKAEEGEERPKVTVFPNPYRGDAVWDGEFPRERLIYFANLPARCTIRIFTLAGDLVDEIEFDADSYHGENAAAIFDPDFDPPELSGGLAAWDLLTKEDQSIASGLYVFSVEDHDGGETEVGKFLVIR